MMSEFTTHVTDSAEQPKENDNSLPPKNNNMVCFKCGEKVGAIFSFEPKTKEILCIKCSFLKFFE